MKDFVGLLKLPPTILAGLMIASGVIMFLPDRLISRLYMDSLKEEYGFIIGAVFIVSVSILGAYVFVKAGKKIHRVYRDKRFIKHKKAFLEALESEDKHLIKTMMGRPGRTLKLPMQHATVIKLAHFMVITPASSTQIVDSDDMRLTYFLQPWVVKEIESNPSLLN